MKVEVQDVGVVEFPDDAKPEEISKVLNERYPSPEAFGKSVAEAVSKPSGDYAEPDTIGAIRQGVGAATKWAGERVLDVANIPTTIANKISGAPPGNPNYVEPLTEHSLTPQIPRSKGTGTAAGVYNLAASTAQGMIPPFAPPQVGLSLPALAVGGAPARVAGAAFGTEALSAIPEQYQAARELPPTATRAEKVEAYGTPVVSAGLGALMLKSAAGKRAVADEKIPGKIQVGSNPIATRAPSEYNAKDVVQFSGDNFIRAVKSSGKSMTRLSYDWAKEITSADIPRMEETLSTIRGEVKSGQADPSLNWKSQLYDEAIKMRKAMDEAVSTDAKTDAELAVIAKKYGVGIGTDAQSLAKELRDNLNISKTDLTGVGISAKPSDAPAPEVAPAAGRTTEAPPIRPAGEVVAEAPKEVAPLPEGRPTKESGTTEAPPVSQPELVGMGGATPAEFKTTPETPTSIKNAQVDVERQKRGLPPAIQPAKRSFGTVWDETMSKIDRDPGYQDRLIGELRENPRSLTDAEDAALLHRQIDLQNEYGKATRDLAQAYDDGRMDAVGNEQARVAVLSDQLLDLYNVGKKVGTETGRGLNARKMMAYEDFSLAKMELEKRAANGGRPLTPEERTQITELQSRIETTQKAYDDYVSKTDQRTAEMEVKRALDEIERQAKKEPTIHPRILNEAERIVKLMEKSADAARVRLREKFARTSAGVDPTILSDLSIIGAAKIARGVVEFGKWSDAMIKDIGEGIQPFLKDAWEASNKQFDSSIDKLSKAGTASQIKRAVKKTDVAEQIQTATATIKERVSEGRRSEISGQVKKLARLFVERGVKTRDELIDSVHSVLKTIDPNFTRRETMDAISGYGDFKQLTKDEISVKLRDLKGQMQQVAKLEDMQANRPPLKTGIERRIPSQEESRLIKLVNEAKNQFQIPIDDPSTQLKSSLDTLKTRLKNATLEFQDKLARGDFSKKEKRVIQMDAEANRLHFENAKAKIAWHEALMKDRLANRTLPEKLLGNMMETLNTSRALMTSLDFSAVLRQGGFIAFAHPVRAAKSLPAMFRAFRSEAGQHAVNQEILARKNYPLYNQSKLYLAEHGHKLSAMEEAYMSRWADKIPLVAGSQRAYVTFLNKLRADSFDAMANTLSRTGELTPTEAKAISNFINVATGRGNLGAKENTLVGLNTIFFAPRYVASRFQLIAGQPLYRGTARTRIQIAKEYARFLIGVGTVYSLAKMGGADVETDARSSDFGKIKIGNTRIDPLAGLAQSTVLLTRLARGETKNSRGKIIPIRGPKVPFGGDNSADVLFRFLRTKLSPWSGTSLDVVTGEDVVNKPVTATSALTGLLIPLSMRDIYKAMREQGVPAGTALAILSIFGMGVQTYDDKKKASNN